jgi:hypothetical protein
MQKYRAPILSSPIAANLPFCCHWVGILGGLGHSQWKFYVEFYDINYFGTLDLIMIWHCIYEEKDKNQFHWDEIGPTYFQCLENYVKLLLW